MLRLKPTVNRRRINMQILAGHLAAWFLGANDANKIMYSVTTGRCFDGMQSAASVNINSGAESTIEALLTMENVENYPAVKAAFE